jgi:signal transduction histidine kinase
LKFTEKGSVTIQCSIELKLDELQREESELNQITENVNVDSSKYLKISIIDTGMGISKEN